MPNLKLKLVNKNKSKRKNKAKSKKINTENTNTTLTMDTFQEINNAHGINPTTTINSTSTPTQKRLREVMQNSLMGNACKTPRLTSTETPLKLITIMDKRFDKLTDLLQNMIHEKFNECKQDLLINFEKSFNIIKNELHTVTERVQQLETVAENIKSMQDEIKILKTKVQKQENNSVSCELRLNEIPFNPDENLYEIFDKICIRINTSVPAVKTIYRLQNHSNKYKADSKDAVIIVKMWSPYDRNYFLKTLANFRKINKGFFFSLRDIGMNSDTKFFVNENLTAKNYNILRAALRLKKSHRIHSAFPIRGMVNIKIHANDQPIQIDELEHLNNSHLTNLFRDHDVSTSNAGVYHADAIDE